MEFNEKLQELRKGKGLTQEELAKELYVSRTAISKWESGRGYPSIDSLKEIARFFKVTVDELLSSGEVLTIAEGETKRKQVHIRDLLFGLLDLSVALLFFLPIFGQSVGGAIEEVALVSLSAIAVWLKSAYFAVVSASAVCGVLTLALQNCGARIWVKYKGEVSLTLGALGVLLFTVSRQPYAATLLFAFLIIKVLAYIKCR